MHGHGHCGWRLLWRVEDAFQKIAGVCEAVSGYTGGHTVNPSYEDVCRGDTGHAEAVLVPFDPAPCFIRADFTAFLKFMIQRS